MRLPFAVSDLFFDWRDTHRPLVRKQVGMLERGTRGGELDDGRFGCRMRGEASYADGIAATYRVLAHKFGLDRSLSPLDISHFRPLRTAEGQMHLF